MFLYNLLVNKLKLLASNFPLQKNNGTHFRFWISWIQYPRKIMMFSMILKYNIAILEHYIGNLWYLICIFLYSTFTERLLKWTASFVVSREKNEIFPTPLTTKKGWRGAYSRWKISKYRVKWKIVGYEMILWFKFKWEVDAENMRNIIRGIFLDGLIWDINRAVYFESKRVKIPRLHNHFPTNL